MNLTHRILSLGTVAGLSLVLAACGSTAIGTTGTPGSTPTSQTSGAGISLAGQPSKAATKKAHHPAKATATAHPSSTATHSSTSKGSGSSTGTKKPAHPSGSPTVAAAACTWQSGSPSIIVTPCTGLTSGQTITLQGRGFDPKKRVLAVECLANATGQNACNLPKNLSLLNLPKTWAPNADGTVTINLTVQKSFYGNTCSTKTPCIVTIASTDQKEDPSAPISFR